MAHTGSLNGLPMVLALIGAIFDWAYLRKGGKPATHREKVILVAASFALFGCIVLLAARGATGFALGELTADSINTLFICWELGRWWTRRKNPLRSEA